MEKKDSDMKRCIAKIEEVDKSGRLVKKEGAVI